MQPEYLYRKATDCNFLCRYKFNTHLAVDKRLKLTWRQNTFITFYLLYFNIKDIIIKEKIHLFRIFKFYNIWPTIALKILKGKNYKAQIELMTHRFIVKALKHCATLLCNSFWKVKKFKLCLILFLLIGITSHYGSVPYHLKFKF